MAQIGLTLKDWLKRRYYLGGSDMSIVAGMNKYKSAFQLWEEKTGAYTPMEQDMSNQFTIAGHVFEPIVLDMFKMYMEEIHSAKVEYTSHLHLVHPDHPFLVSHPDETLDNHDIVDAKTSMSRVFFDKWGTQENPSIPVEYQYQGIYNSGIYWRQTGNLPKRFWIPVLKLTLKDYKVAGALADNGQLASWANLTEHYLTEKELAMSKQVSLNKWNKHHQKTGEELDFAVMLEEDRKIRVYKKLKKKFEVRVFNFNKTTFEQMEKNAIEWWTKHIVGKEQPKITYKDSDYLKTKYRFYDADTEIEIGEELDKLVAQMNAAKFEAKNQLRLSKTTPEHKAYELNLQRANHLEALILNKMKKHETAIGKLLTITSETKINHSIKYEKLEIDEPEVFRLLKAKGYLSQTFGDRKLIVEKEIKG